MVLILYTDAKYEYQAVAAMRSLEPYMPHDLKLLYFTVDFDTEFKMRNLQTIRTTRNDRYPSFIYYKPELCLKAFDLYPDERYFFYADSDILFSPRIDFEKLKCEESYPLAAFGPHEYPFIWEHRGLNAEFIVYNEVPLMKYLNVPQRTLRYQWASFQSFNRDCIDFYEEYYSLCQNTYLSSRAQTYFPISDETPFNVLLWKRNATKSLGFVFVNTHLTETIRDVEEKTASKYRDSKVIDTLGASWEYIDSVDDIMFYHGAKERQHIDSSLNYLLTLIP